jgi:pantothenate kinase
MRAFCSSKNGNDRSNAVHYHVSIGRNILKIVAAEFISEEKLFELLFNTLKIEKTEKSLAQLEEVSAEYEIYCLKH